MNAPAYTNIQLRLSGFTIAFDMSAPIRWSNPAGAGPALFDPENNPAGIEHAVIDTRDSNTNLNLTSLACEQHADRRAAGFRRIARSAAISAQARPDCGDSAAQYVGELAIDLVRTNDLDTGSISNSSFQGGSIELYGGPWTITRKHGLRARCPRPTRPALSRSTRRTT